MEASTRVRRLYAAAELAPEIQFPIDLRSQRAAPVVFRAGASGSMSDGQRWPGCSRRRADLLGLRVKLTDRDAEHGTGFQDAGAGCQECEILMVGDVNQPVERGVAGTPSTTARTSAGRCGPTDRPIATTVRDRCVRGFEIRPNFTRCQRKPEAPTKSPPGSSCERRLALQIQAVAWSSAGLAHPCRAS